jgi:hypothetical protein
MGGCLRSAISALRMGIMNLIRQRIPDALLFMLAGLLVGVDIVWNYDALFAPQSLLMS